MELTLRNVNIYTFVDITGSVKDDDSLRFKDTVLNIVNQGKKDIVINLSNTISLNSQAFGAIVVIWKIIVENKGSLFIITNPAKLKNSFDSTNLKTIIDIFDSEDDFNDQVLSKRIKQFFVKSHIHGNYTVIDLADSVGIIAESDQIDTIFNSVTAQKNTSVALNMTDIIHINSTAMGILIKWSKHLKESNNKFCLFAVNNNLMYYMELIGLNTVVKIYDKEEDIKN